MSFRAILETLAAAEVDFVVIGGVSAVLQGVPTNTFDLDIVHSRQEENPRRLFRCLGELEACYREHLPKVLAPIESDLDSDEDMLLMTSEGPLDVLGTVTGERRYEDLMPETEVTDLGGGAVIRILALEALIRMKEETGRQKDLAQLPILRRTLAERLGGSE